MCSPSQVLGDIYTEVLEAAHPLHRGRTDHKSQLKSTQLQRKHLKWQTHNCITFVVKSVVTMFFDGIYILFAILLQIPWLNNV